MCGSLAHGDPAAELPALAVASDAVIGIVGADGHRQVGAADFFLGPFWTALDEGEIVTEARFPAPPAGSVTIVDEISRRAGDFAVAGLVAVFEAEAGAVSSARLAGFGLGGVPTRLATAETAAQGWTAGSPTDAIMEAVLADTGDAFEDIHATGWYRSEAVAALVVRAVRSALAGKEAA